MLTRLAALIVKELRAVWRDPKGRAVVVVPPLVQLLVFAFAATQEVRNVDLAVLDEDRGRWARELVARIEAADAVAEVVVLDGPADLRASVDGQRVLAAVRIPQGFSADVAAGRPATIQAVFDGRRSTAAQILLGYLDGIVGTLRAEIAGGAERVTIEPRNWFNPNLEYVWFTVPSLIAMITLLVGVMVTGLSVARERELGTFDQLLVSPLRPLEILVGKTVPALLIGLGHGTAYVLVARFGFGIPLVGSVPLLYAAMVLYLVAVIGVGLFISSLATTQQQAILGAFLFAAPAILLSGFATPVENMPDWLQTLTLANPLRHFLVVVKGVFLKDLPAEAAAASMAPLALIALATLAAATWLFRRRVA